MYVLAVCRMNIEVEREEDDRWIAEIPGLQRCDDVRG